MPACANGVREEEADEAEEAEEAEEEEEVEEEGEGAVASLGRLWVCRDGWLVFFCCQMEPMERWTKVNAWICRASRAVKRSPWRHWADTARDICA